MDVDRSRPCISHSADPDDVTTTLERVNLGALGAYETRIDKMLSLRSHRGHP